MLHPEWDRDYINVGHYLKPKHLPVDIIIQSWTDRDGHVEPSGSLGDLVMQLAAQVEDMRLYEKPARPGDNDFNVEEAYAFMCLDSES